MPAPIGPEAQLSDARPAVPSLSKPPAHPLQHASLSCVSARVYVAVACSPHFPPSQAVVPDWAAWRPRLTDPCPGRPFS